MSVPLGATHTHNSDSAIPERDLLCSLLDDFGESGGAAMVPVGLDDWSGGGILA